MPIKDKVSDVVNDNSDMTKIDNSKLLQDDIKKPEMVGMQENPTEEHLRNIDQNDQLKSSETTTDEMLINKHDSQSFNDVKDNSGGRLIYLKMLLFYLYPYRL